MKRVLIIEDEQSIAEIERDYLEANGYAADVKPDGISGLEFALKNDYDLIILDIMLPDIDGFQVCKQIRGTKETPILFVSAKLDDIDKIKGFSVGADDYIIKPFSFNELVARVNAHIARFEKLTGLNGVKNRQEVTIKDLRVNLSSHQVFLSGTELFLPNREYELLCFFMQNPEQVFSKDDLLNKVWGTDAYVEINTVAVHINRLRAKIETDLQNPLYIKTVWGVGYKLALY